MIRPFRSEDTGAVMEIWLAASLAAHSFIDASYWHEQFPVVRDVYLPVSRTFVFTEQDHVRGFLSVLDDDMIGALFVAPSWQERGIGSALLRHVLEMTDALTLCVYVENTAARIFYEKRGFGIVSRRATETGHDEYVMRWVAKS